MPVDSFKFLPRLIEKFYRLTEVQSSSTIPWTPLLKPVQESSFGLVTSAGLYNKSQDEPFDLGRELREPTWGDPSERRILRTTPAEQIGVSHLHLNTKPILEDPNIVLPLERMQELEEMGEIGRLAATHFSLMGYQGYPPDTSTWEEQTAPRIAAQFQAEEVDCVLLTPA
jgi:D-proline reductase (dithiol) PrdB